MKDKLLNCPCCGREPVAEFHTKERIYWIRCKCGIETRGFKQKATTIKKWNSRV